MPSRKPLEEVRGEHRPLPSTVLLQQPKEGFASGRSRTQPRRNIAAVSRYALTHTAAAEKEDRQAETKFVLISFSRLSLSSSLSLCGLWSVSYSPPLSLWSLSLSLYLWPLVSEIEIERVVVCHLSSLSLSFSLLLPFVLPFPMR